jgi:hypothetical protein
MKRGIKMKEKLVKDLVLIIVVIVIIFAFIVIEKNKKSDTKVSNENIQQNAVIENEEETEEYSKEIVIGKYLLNEDEDVLGEDFIETYGNCGIVLNEDNTFEMMVGNNISIEGTYEIAGIILKCTATSQIQNDDNVTKLENTKIEFELVGNKELELINIDSDYYQNGVISNGIVEGFSYKIK